MAPYNKPTYIDIREEGEWEVVSYFYFSEVEIENRIGFHPLAGGGGHCTRDLD